MNDGGREGGREGALLFSGIWNLRSDGANGWDIFLGSGEWGVGRQVSVGNPFIRTLSRGWADI